MMSARFGETRAGLRLSPLHGVSPHLIARLVATALLTHRADRAPNVRCFFYYPGHVDLERAVIDEVARFLIVELVAPIQQQVKRAAEILENILIGFVACIDTYPDHARVWLEWSTAIRDNLWPLCLEFQARMVKYFKATIERGKREATLPSARGVDDTARVLVGLRHRARS